MGAQSHNEVQVKVLGEGLMECLGLHLAHAMKAVWGIQADH